MNFAAIPRAGAWAILRSGSSRCRVIGLSRAAAWREARRLARGEGGRAYLFGPDGRIIARNDYGATE